jgi:uncharacterized membrane protein
VEELFKLGTHFIATGVEAAAALVIAIAVARAMVRIARLLLRPRGDVEESKESIRIGLGRWLALALELTLAADILRTAVAPTWNEIGQLAAIVVLRTVLNFFLQREIASESAHAHPVAKGV